MSTRPTPLLTTNILVIHNIKLSTSFGTNWLGAPELKSNIWNNTFKLKSLFSRLLIIFFSAFWQCCPSVFLRNTVVLNLFLFVYDVCHLFHVIIICRVFADGLTPTYHDGSSYLFDTWLNTRWWVRAAYNSAVHHRVVSASRIWFNGRTRTHEFEPRENQVFSILEPPRIFSLSAGKVVL